MTSPTIIDSRWYRWMPLLALAIAAFAVPLAARAEAAAVASTDTTVPAAGADEGSDEGLDDELLREGAEVYSAVCSSCHQPGGVGLSGQYPPLVDNPHVADADYVATVIAEGRTGEIEVAGTVYDGVMPAQSTLTDADADAVIYYIQSGFAAPSTPAVEIDDGTPVAGTSLPLLADYAWIAAFLVAIGGVLLVLGPRIVSANSRLELSWFDAWMKTAVIVVGTIVAVAIIPAKVLEFEAVQELPRTAQDLIAVGLWGAGLVIALGALWYAHRERRI